MKVVIVSANTLYARGLEVMLGELGSGMDVARAGHLGQAVAMLRDAVPAALVFSPEAVPEAPRSLDEAFAKADHLPGMLAVVSPGTPPERLLRFVRPGWGFLFDTSDSGLIRVALDAVVAGKAFAEPTAVQGLLLVVQSQHRPPDPLLQIDPESILPRRCQGAVVLAAQGWSDRWIATILGHSEETIGTYLCQAYRCLRIKGRGELIARFQQAETTSDGRLHPSGSRGRAADAGGPYPPRANRLKPTAT